MSKPVWTHTHTGEQGEELCCIDNMYFTKFAWDHFLAAYTGKVLNDDIADWSPAWRLFTGDKYQDEAISYTDEEFRKIMQDGEK